MMRCCSAKHQCMHRTMTMRLFYCVALLLSVSGCAERSASDVLQSANSSTPVGVIASEQPTMASAIAFAPPASKRVLRTVDDMMNANEIIVGGCWDYLNEAFNRAGYPQAKRQTVFKGKYKGGRYADGDAIQPGDWLYYVNHSYNDVEHSGLFIGWTDKAKREALIFSYAGEGRKDPARFGVYHIDQVYNIMRAQN